MSEKKMVACFRVDEKDDVGRFRVIVPDVIVDKREALIWASGFLEGAVFAKAKAELIPPGLGLDFHIEEMSADALEKKEEVMVDLVDGSAVTIDKMRRH